MPHAYDSLGAQRQEDQNFKIILSYIVLFEVCLSYNTPLKERKERRGRGKGGRKGGRKGRLLEKSN